MKTSLLALSLSFVGLFSTAADAAPLDPNAWYRLTTEFQGECKSLDVINDDKKDKLHLAPTDDVSGQHWKLTPVGDGYYRLTTMFTGPGKSLDIINGGNQDTPTLAPTGNYLGQHWKLTPNGDGTYRMTTRWKGTGRSLDIVNDAKAETPILAPTGSVSGQAWRLTKETSVGPVPSTLGLSSFYAKYLDAEGLPIVSSSKVPDAALYRVRYMVRQMLSRMPSVRAKLKTHKMRVVVMSTSEVTSNVPEFNGTIGTHTADGRHIDEVRGFGGTLTIPVTLCAEENVLCKKPDGSSTEDIFIHEFAHTLEVGMKEVWGAQFETELAALFAKAKLEGLFANTYAATNASEYFAEGVQSWFNINAEALPGDTIHNYVNTRKELKQYDPALHAFLSRYFPEDENNCSCHEKGAVQTPQDSSVKKKIRLPTMPSTKKPRLFR